jgi:hypothetical protein
VYEKEGGSKEGWWLLVGGRWLVRWCGAKRSERDQMSKVGKGFDRKRRGPTSTDDGDGDTIRNPSKPQ